MRELMETEERNTQKYLSKQLSELSKKFSINPKEGKEKKEENKTKQNK